MNTTKKDWSHLTTNELELVAMILELIIAMELQKRVEAAQRAKLAPATVSLN